MEVIEVGVSVVYFSYFSLGYFRINGREGEEKNKTRCRGFFSLVWAGVARTFVLCKGGIACTAGTSGFSCALVLLWMKLLGALLGGSSESVFHGWNEGSTLEARGLFGIVVFYI